VSPHTAHGRTSGYPVGIHRTFFKRQGTGVNNNLCREEVQRSRGPITFDSRWDWAHLWTRPTSRMHIKRIRRPGRAGEPTRVSARPPAPGSKCCSYSCGGHPRPNRRLRLSRHPFYCNNQSGQPSAPPAPGRAPKNGAAGLAPKYSAIGYSHARKVYKERRGESSAVACAIERESHYNAEEAHSASGLLQCSRFNPSL